MKGFSIQNGIEFKISLEGEHWAQSSQIQVEVSTLSGQRIRVSLAEGNEKKVKAKDANAFTVIETQEGIGPSFKTHFAVPKNARITDKSGSLFLLYGNQDPLANLKLIIDPHPLLIEIRDVLIRHFRFALKATTTGKKSRVEFKFEPSGAKEWASLSHLFARFSQETSGIHLELEFHRTIINALKPGLAAEKVSRCFQREMPQREIVHDFNQRLNSEVVISILQEVFQDYQNQSWLPA
jgi:hypothetical protein